MTLILPDAPNVTKAVIQDREEVIENAARGFWAGQDASVYPPGRVMLQANDFSAGQPVKGAQAYFLRYILHE